MIRTALAITAALLSTAAVSAADLIIPTSPEPIYEAGGVSWEGLYVGARAGGQWFTAATYGVVGGVVGFNFMPADHVVLGAEATADYTWNNVRQGGEYFVNIRGGFLASEAVLIYALGGLGVYNSSDRTVGIFQLGGGAEFALTDAVSIRGEVVGQGDYANNNSPFFDTAKATVGVAYHF
ncbi:outer membrane beta-barrel protein [Devosia sp. BK]|uniref:outer membrane protein n=1 Tax=Devosia sp. BK TaxID=2871706 RepID=UPI00293AB552|nr:outer membrane beta-barrel protein [Devosia sp. BK]MDV3251791.1 outer membrane beta-barrel protein [Devosia sp. BK]